MRSSFARAPSSSLKCGAVRPARQARLAHLLRAVDDRLARDAGVLLGLAANANAIGATVVSSPRAAIAFSPATGHCAKGLGAPASWRLPLSARGSGWARPPRSGRAGTAAGQAAGQPLRSGFAGLRIRRHGPSARPMITWPPPPAHGPPPIRESVAAQRDIRPPSARPMITCLPADTRRRLAVNWIIRCRHGHPALSAHPMITWPLLPPARAFRSKPGCRRATM